MFMGADARHWLLLRLNDTIAKFVIGARKRAEWPLRSSEERLAIELADMQVLQRIGDELVREQSPQRLYEAIVNAAALLMRSEASSMREYDRRTQRLKLVAWQGFHPEA